MLSAAEDAELIRLLEVDAEGETLVDFIKRVSPHHPPPRHLMPLIDLIQRARHETVRAVVSMPPRHGKSETIKHGIAWWMTQSPADTHAYCSYNDHQAWSKSGPMRDLAVRAGVELKSDSASKAEWRTSNGGGLLAVGVGSGLTGQGISGLLVVDDALKNYEEASSQVTRDAVWDWFTSVAMTRSEGASIIVVMTRWHQDDLIGRIIDLDEGWEVVNLPAIADEADELGRAPGEALWPENYPVEPCETKRCAHSGHLGAIRKTIGEYLFASLYQGRPRPRGHLVFGKPTYYDPATFNITGKQIVIYADPAGTGKTSSDHAAILALAVDASMGLDNMAGWVLEVYREQVSVPTFMDDLRAFQARNGGARARVEAVGGFKAIPDMLEKVDASIDVEGDQPIGDKFTRAQPVAAAWNDGRVMVPIDAPWLKAFLKEIGNFTGVNDASDDQEDCLSGAWNSVRPIPTHTRLRTVAARRM